jgi:hypothetical protein
MRKGTLQIVFVLSFINCTSPSRNDIKIYPQKDKSTSINSYIKTDTMFQKLYSSDFNVTEILTKDIQEGSIVNARVKFKKIKILENEPTDTTIWINDIIMSSENDIIKWGNPGIREELFLKSKEEEIYHVPIKIKSQ